MMGSGRTIYNSFAIGVMILVGGGAISLNGREGDYMMRTGFPLAALNNVDVRDARVAAGHLLKEIVEGYGVDYTAQVIEDDGEFYELLSKDAFDFFIIFGYDYLRLIGEYPMRPVLVGQHSDKHLLNRYRFITSASVSDLQELADGRLLVQKGAGKLPLMWFEEACDEQGISLRPEDFHEVEHVGNVSQALLPVFFGKAQACVVSESGYETMVELNPQIGKRLKTHLISEAFLTSVLCFRPGYVEKEPGIVLREGLKLNERPKGQQLLTLFRTKKLLEFKPEYLKSLENLLAKKDARRAKAGDTASTGNGEENHGGP